MTRRPTEFYDCRQTFSQCYSRLPAGIEDCSSYGCHFGCLQNDPSLSYVIFSKKQIILQHAGYVVRFLRLWRLHVKHTRDQCTQTNFYPNQTFRHVLLSCMFAVMYIIACRDQSPEKPICLHRLGSDCCEKCFSMTGGCGEYHLRDNVTCHPDNFRQNVTTSVVYN